MLKIIDQIKIAIIKNIDILIIVALATIIRFLAIFKNYHFWMDEMFSFVYSQKPWLDSFRFWTWETNPPLHMFILKIWFYLFPVNELSARLPSLIFGVVSIYFLYQLNKKLFNKNTAQISALILALSPIHNLYSITARTYSLLILLSILSTKYFLEIFYFNNKNKRNVLTFAIVNFLFLYSHLTSLMILFCQFITLLAYKKTEIKKWIQYNTLSAILWCIWAIPSVYIKLNLKTFQNTWFFNLSNGFWDAIKALQFFSIGLGTNIYWGLLFIIIFLTLFGLTTIQQIKQKNTNDKFLMVSLFLFIPTFSTFILGLLEPKFYLLSLPYLATVMAYIIEVNFKNKIIKFLPLIIFIPGLIIFLKSLPINNWDAACRFIDKNRNNSRQILIYDNYTNKNEINYYCQPKIPSIPYLPVTNLNWDKFLITQNYKHLNPTDSELQNWINRQNILSFDQIFLIQYPSNAFINIKIAEILEKNGYHQLSQPMNVAVLNRPAIYWFGK